MYGLFCKEIVYFIFLSEYVFIDWENVCNIYYYTHYTYSAKLSFKSMYKKSYKIGPIRFNKWNFNVSQFPNKWQFILLKINLLPFHVDSIHYFFLGGLIVVVFICLFGVFCCYNKSHYIMTIKKKLGCVCLFINITYFLCRN